MTDFDRVNAGVAFGDEVFTPADANGLRTNGELLWQNEVLRFSRANVDVTDMYYAAASTFGPLTWHNYYRCFLAAGPSIGGAGQCLMTAGVGAPASVSMRAVGLSPPASANTPVIFGGASTSPYVYQGVSDGANFLLYGSADWSTWGLYNAATFTPSVLRAAPAVSGVYTVIPGSADSYRSMLVVSTSGVTIGAKACTSSTSSSAITSVATNGTIAVGVCGLDTAGHGRQAPLATAGTGSDFTITKPATVSTVPFVAYDARTSQWVVLAEGASGYDGNIYWAPRASVDWSSGSWYSLATGYAAINVHDFTITTNGIWIVSAWALNSYVIFEQLIFASIDAGANWSVHPIGVVGMTGTPTSYPRFGSANGPCAALSWRPSDTTIEVLTSGQINNGTTIASAVI